MGTHSTFLLCTLMTESAECFRPCCCGIQRPLSLGRPGQAPHSRALCSWHSLEMRVAMSRRIRLRMFTEQKFNPRASILGRNHTRLCFTALSAFRRINEVVGSDPAQLIFDCTDPRPPFDLGRRANTAICAKAVEARFNFTRPPAPTIVARCVHKMLETLCSLLINVNDPSVLSGRQEDTTTSLPTGRNP